MRRAPPAALPAATQEGADGGLVRLAVIAGDVGAGHPHRVAEEEVVLVRRLSRPEKAEMQVFQTRRNSRNQVGAAQRGRLEVGLDVGRGRAGDVGLVGGAQAGRAQLAQDLGEPLVSRGYRLRAVFSGAQAGVRTPNSSAPRRPRPPAAARAAS